MADEISQILRRLDGVESNQTLLAKSHTEFVQDLGEIRKPLDELRTDREVRKERDKNLNERLDRIEEGQRGIYRLGWWVLATFGASAIALIVNFAFSGGFRVQ